MFRIETVQFASQDDLPPEILRRLQVEELWARRDVLADLMNAERLEIYAQRCTDLAAGRAQADAGPADRLTRLAATVVPMRNRKPMTPVAPSPASARLGMSPKLALAGQVKSQHPFLAKDAGTTRLQ